MGGNSRPLGDCPKPVLGFNSQSGFGKQNFSYCFLTEAIHSVDTSPTIGTPLRPAKVCLL